MLLHGCVQRRGALEKAFSPGKAEKREKMPYKIIAKFVEPVYTLFNILYCFFAAESVNIWWAAAVGGQDLVVLAGTSEK